MRADPIIPAVKRTSPRTAVRRLALGRFISYTGTVASGTALSYSLYAETGSAAWVAAAMILTWGVIGLLGPISGAIGDRFDRRLVMIVGESAAAACWLVMAFLTDLPVIVLALAFLASVFEAPFPAASGAAAPFASPKSSTFARPSARTITLPGFRSRWTIPASCADSSASATCLAMASA